MSIPSTSEENECWIEILKEDCHQQERGYPFETNFTGQADQGQRKASCSNYHIDLLNNLAGHSTCTCLHARLVIQVRNISILYQSCLVCSLSWAYTLKVHSLLNQPAPIVFVDSS